MSPAKYFISHSNTSARTLSVSLSLSLSLSLFLSLSRMCERERARTFCKINPFSVVIFPEETARSTRKRPCKISYFSFTRMSEYFLSHTRTHTHPLTHSISLSPYSLIPHSLARARALSLSPSHPLTHSISLSFTHTHSISLSLPVAFVLHPLA